MVFKVGETVVYPHHGASTIEDITVRNIKGREIEYLVLRVQAGGLKIEVPSANADYVGVRDVVSQEGLEKVFDVLRQPYIEEPTNWSRRYKANVEKIASGDVIKVAEVVRDLYRRNEDLITIGAYAKGANPKLDLAIAVQEAMGPFLRQGFEEACGRGQTMEILARIFNPEQE